MSKKNGTAVAEVKNDALVIVGGAVAPSYINQESHRGSENVTTDDLVIPRLEIVQGLSPAVKKGDPGFIKGAAQGMYNNSVTRELYGEEVTVVPVYFSVQFLVWRDRKLAEAKGLNTDGGFFGAYNSEDEARRRANEEGGEAAAIIVQDTPTHLCLIINPTTFEAEEIMIPMPKTKAKVSRQWNSIIKLAGGDRFSRAYRLTTILESKPKGDYYNFGVEILGYPSKALYDKAEALYKAVCAGKGRTMDMSDLEEVEPGSASDDM